MLNLDEYEPNLVSVIIPTYNRANLITETIESVVSQTYRPIELIIVDDGSIDNTKESIELWKGTHENNDQFRLLYLYQNNTGHSAARNIGIIKSRGEFLQFLDSDDLLDRRKIELQMIALKESNCTRIAYCPWRTLFDSSLLKYGPLRQKHSEQSEDCMLRGQLSGSWFVPLHSLLFPRKIVMQVGSWDENITIEADADYLIRTLVQEWKLLHVPDACVYYRRHQRGHVSSSIDMDNSLKRFSSNLKVRAKAYKLLEDIGKADMYNNELKLSYASLTRKAAVYEEFVSLESCSNALRKLLSGVTVKKRHLLLRRAAKRLIRGHPFRIFRAKIGDYTLAWLGTLMARK